jgi:hypothetical protein
MSGIDHRKTSVAQNGATRGVALILIRIHVSKLLPRLLTQMHMLSTNLSRRCQNRHGV